MRIYLETTVFNYYFDIDRAGHEDTVRLFDAIGAGRFEAWTSGYVVLELTKTADEHKRSSMLDLAASSVISVLDHDADAEALAEIYVSKGLIPRKYMLDAVHIAIASIHALDKVVSYNFEHINRAKTKIGVNEINEQLGHNRIDIATSKEVMEYA